MLVQRNKGNGKNFWVINLILSNSIGLKLCILNGDDITLQGSKNILSFLYIKHKYIYRERAHRYTVYYFGIKMSWEGQFRKQKKCLRMFIRGTIMKNMGQTISLEVFYFNERNMCLLCWFCFCPAIVYNKNNLILTYHLMLCPFSPSPSFLENK